MADPHEIRRAIVESGRECDRRDAAQRTRHRGASLATAHGAVDRRGRRLRRARRASRGTLSALRRRTSGCGKRIGPLHRAAYRRKTRRNGVVRAALSARQHLHANASGGRVTAMAGSDRRRRARVVIVEDHALTRAGIAHRARGFVRRRRGGRRRLSRLGSDRARAARRRRDRHRHSGARRHRADANGCAPSCPRRTSSS